MTTWRQGDGGESTVRNNTFCCGLRPALICFILIVFCGSGCNRSPFEGRHTGSSDRPGDKNMSLAVQKAELGSAISLKGEITDPSLVYTFKPYQRGGATRDLFNYLYFQGDTICYSFRLSREIGKDGINAGFINPSTGRYYKAERLDIYHDRVSGFSLVGSVLESFYHDRLGNSLPAGMYCCKEIPFIVKLTVHADGKTVESSIRGAFRIEYR